jgi:hypothetical protein
MYSRRTQIWATALVGLACAAGVASGVRTLIRYESTPGAVGVVANSWPAVQVALASDRPTLVLLAHPRCPCTRASIGELARIIATSPGKVAAYVLFSKPEDAGADWEDTGLQRSAAEIPGVTVVSDPAGTEARRFGAETSGHTLLFAPDGRLLFSGGITPARGHAGDNAGADAIASILRTGTSDRAQTFVFGCSLVGADESPAPAVAAR